MAKLDLYNRPRTPAILSLVLALVVVLLSIAPASASASEGVVISELRTRGPAGGNDEFVELVNTSNAPVNISGWSLRGCNSFGTIGTRATVPAGKELAPGQHYLFTNTASGGYSGSVPGETNYSTGITDTGGARLADASGETVDQAGSTGSNPCKEGAGLNLPTANGENAFERKSGGTQDTDDNAADFDGPKAGDPQNSGSVPPPPPPAITKIQDIQGPGAESPIVGQKVTIEGVVTGIDDEIGASFGANNMMRTFPEDAGIFVQEEAADADSDSNTSEGIFVGFVRDRNNYKPGDIVRVNGEVREKFGQTILSETRDEEPQKTGTKTAVPEPVEIEIAQAEVQDPSTRPYYETFEGMRVGLVSGTANSGSTNKFGELFMTLGTEQDRVFRTENPPDLIATADDAGASDPDNPYRPEQESTTVVEADLFDRVDDAVGPLSFSFDHYKIMVQEDRLPTVSDGPIQYPYSDLTPAGPKQLRIASFNVENLFPTGGELDGGVVSQEEYDEKRARVADAIDDLLERPNIVAVQEIGESSDKNSLATLRDLAAELNEGRTSDQHYTAYLEEGNDSRGIDVGFLVKENVNVANVTQYDPEEPKESLDCSDVDGKLFDRPPLALEIKAEGFGEFTVFSNHFASKAAPDECRVAQAAFVRDRVAELETVDKRAVVAGDLNAFEDESALTTLEDGTTTLDNLWDRAPAEERYSFAFQGKLQTLDHILVTQGLQSKVRDFRYAHFDNDYYERDDPADGHHVSDHDPPVLTLLRGDSR